MAALSTASFSSFSNLYPLFSTTPLRFGTKIEYVSSETFFKNKPSDKTLISNDPYHISNRVSLKPTGYTEFANECSIIAIHNGKSTTVAHLSPRKSVKENNEIIEGLEADIQALKRESTEPLHATIVGGIGFKSACSKRSKELFHLLRKLTKRTEIPNLSVLWGVKTAQLNLFGYTNLFCDAVNDKILISNPKIADNKEAISKSFRIFHIAEGDSFEIEGDKS